VNTHPAKHGFPAYDYRVMKDTSTARAGEPASSVLQPQTNPPEHILVAEDDSFFRRLNTQVLLRSGYAVDAAADGAAAWQALNAGTYDLLITDNNMPKMSGVELLKKLRGARMALPVIMATGALPKKEFARSPWLQPTATLIKPYTGAEMLRTVKEVLREKESIAEDRELQGNKPPPGGEPARPIGQRPTSPAHRILVVEEDSDLRQLYSEALAGPGYHVDATDDGAAAWEALKANRYHLLITEHEIPSLTGVELIKMLRGARMALPVVMAAGRLPTHELARNTSLLVAATLAKPFAVDTLLDTVEHVLRATDSTDESTWPLPNWRSQPSGDGLSL